MENERKEVLISDLGAVCEPKQALSDYRELYKWAVVPYETAEIKGSALVSMRDGKPNEVSFDPALKGWYKIYIGLLGFVESEQVATNFRLSSMKAAMRVSPSPVLYAAHAVQEVYLISADMTGEKLFISKHLHGLAIDSMVAWVRFVPMSDEEVKAFVKDNGDQKNKRIYATNDMHGMHACYGFCEQDEWRCLVQDYAQSDVEWLSLENILLFDGQVTTGNPENFAFPRPADKLVELGLKKNFTFDMLRDLVEYGHNMGIKMCSSRRMGAWGMEFPYDEMYFISTFREAHPELRCIDRDGQPVEALSYIYPEVRKYVIGQFLDMARLGFDAVEMIFTRGVPYLLFEPEFVETFKKEYGEDPRYLAQDDERVMALRCRYMTQFVKELREALDKETGKNKTRIHARCHFSMYDAKFIGEDLETWAKEGLISAVISYPQRIREILGDSVWKEGDPTHIDLEKYTDYYRHSPKSVIFRKQDFEFMEPMPDSQGVLQGPATQAERVKEFMELENKYGVTVYLEIMPRHMSPEEYKRRALDLYKNGCGHISLWDTYGRVLNRREWTMMRRMGHIEELENYTSGEGELFRDIRLLTIAGDDVSRYVPAWGG